MWQAFRNHVYDRGVEVVTVGMDTAGAEACRPFIEAAKPEHPSLIDTAHRMAEFFGVVNIPNAVWIDEAGMVVRPAETAPAPATWREQVGNPFEGATEFPDRMLEIFGEAVNIETDPEVYEAALLDWVEHGEQSQFALSPDEVIARSRPRSPDTSRGQAHFELATHLELAGAHDAAVEHFRQAHELVPDNFAYRRQAWSLEPGIEGPLARFWQGPAEGREADWPYASEWLTDVREMGASNYYPPFSP